MTVATANRTDWEVSSVCAKALGVAIPTFKRAAPALGIRCRVIPGRRGLLYNRDDLERALARLAAEEAGRLADAHEEAAQNAACDGSPRGPGRPRKFSENGTARTQKV